MRMIRGFALVKCAISLPRSGFAHAPAIHMPPLRGVCCVEVDSFAMPSGFRKKFFSMVI